MSHTSRSLPFDLAVKDAAADISTMMPSGMLHGTGTYERWVEGAIRRAFERHAVASESRAPVEWHPVSELPPRPGQYLCRLPHQFIVCSYEHSPVDGKYHWNYASVDWWAELPEVPK